MRKNIGVFRGKRKDNGEWAQGNYLCLHQSDDTDLHIIVDEHGIYNPIDPETVGEFTGMTDKHDTAIFEGDVAEYDDRVRMSAIGVVALKNGAWVLTCGKHNYFLYITRNDTKIIGNIHDNPELLEAGKADT